MFGGEFHVEKNSPQLKNDLWKFSMVTMSWSMVHNGTADIDAVPQPRQLAAGCGLLNGYFLLFGGLDSNENVLGDTWIYYIPDKQWYILDNFRSKVGASNATLGIEPEPRGDMAVWCSGYEMFIFGGFNENNGVHHDLWQFSLQSLSWTQSKSSAKLPADHDFVKHLKQPSGRSGATTWVSGDRLLMFGGNIMENNLRSKHMMVGYAGDLWEYDKQMDSWEYFGGSIKVCSTATVFDDLGIPSENMHPGCRRRAAAWIDHNENLWMFGGDGIDDSQESLSVFKHSKLLSDIWFYDLQLHMWTWKGGEKSGDKQGKFGGLDEASMDTLPGSRCETVVWRIWDNFYLFGGIGHDSNGKDGYLNDIWKLDVHLDRSVDIDSPHAGAVFGMIFFSVGLVTVVSGLYLFSRRYLQSLAASNEGQYRRIPSDLEH